VSVVLKGRQAECATLDRLLEELRSGRSAALVLRGDAGIGKSALLGYTAERAEDCRVLWVAGVESEMELPFAGLHQLCAPLLDRLDGLPVPQQAALETAFGLALGTPPDRFLVGLAALSLLSEAAQERPLACLVDDAQWLDGVSAQVLAFVARRLREESVALFFATREPSGGGDLAGLPELALDGLAEPDARELLVSVLPGRLDERVAERIVAETHGNPLALLELPRPTTAAELAGGFGLPGSMPLAGRIEESFRRRVAGLAEETQRLLLLAAAEPVGDPTLLWRAAALVGVGVAAAAPAEAEGLLSLGARVRFRHPLVRSSVYRAASADERRQAHHALAEATDAAVDPDRRAWHRAQAAPAPDEDVAGELERSAGRAQARGGLAAAAAFLEQAARLSPEPARRAARALEAAQAKYQAGAPAAALELLATVEAGPLEALGRARAELLRGQIASAVRRGRDAPPLLLRAARTLEPLDAALARETHLEAIAAAMFAGRLAEGAGPAEVGAAARAAPSAPEPARPIDLLLDGLATRFTDGYAAGAPILKRALQAFRRDGASPAEEIRWLWLACWVAMDLMDDDTWDELSARHLQLVRDAGALTVLSVALTARVYRHLYAGELGPAASLVQEVDAITEATGTSLAPYGALELAAIEGQEGETLELIVATAHEVTSRGEGFGLTVTEWVSALLYNGLGRHEEALTAAGRAADRPGDVGASTWALPELVEAASRSGRADVAADAVERFGELARASGTEWALGLEARSRALVSSGDAADAFYREAIERLGGTDVRLELARAHLLYGSWLRRERRRIEARDHLRTAHELFAAMGANGFAERAERELLATGERARKRTVDTRGQLTAQEGQIARLARDGLSNPEIAARLFISPRTVEYHLHKVFGKLAITSRTELRLALADEPPHTLARSPAA
jgi:DNA-binding CsgD family transcriptional regulator